MYNITLLGKNWEEEDNRWVGEGNMSIYRGERLGDIIQNHGVRGIINMPNIFNFTSPSLVIQVML